MAGTARSVADVMATDPVAASIPARPSRRRTSLLRSTFLKGIPVVDGQGRLVGTICDAHLAAHRFAQVEPIGGQTGTASSVQIG